MDLSCIILSGDLELYVLGMLPEEEATKIEQLAQLFPEVQTELDRISETLEGVAVSATVAPSLSVKDNVMSKLKALKEEEGDAPVEEKVVTPLYKVSSDNDAVEEMTPVIPLHTSKPRGSWLVAASTIGLLLSLGAAIYLASQNSKNETELASLQSKVNTLQNDMASQKQEILAYSQTMEMMQSPDYKKINLATLPGKTEGLAQVLWNTKTHEVFLSDISLPKAPLGKQYQLWAIVDGKPVDAGMVSDAKHLAQKMKVFEKADAFAISIEKEGGNPTPTEVYSMGKI